MILGATHGQHMGEGRRPQSMSSRTPILGLPEMPPQFKADGAMFKPGGLRGPPTFDHNKNSLTHKDSSISHPHAHVSHSGSHPQPFTASWLTEVARMTPLRAPERLTFPGGMGGPSVSDYYQHYQNLPLRSHFYPPPFLTPPYLRDSPHCHHPLRNFSPMDSRPSDLSRSAAGVSPPLVRPLGPPPPPPQPSSLDLRDRLPLDLRDQRDFSSGKLHSRSEFKLSPPMNLPSQGHPPKEPFPGEPSTKKRHIHSPLLPPSPLKPSPSPPKPFVPPWSLTSSGADEATAGQSSYHRPEPLPSEESAQQAASPTPPFHSHFQRGSLVTVGENVRRVEELQTSDFIEAANATEDLSLDPSTVGAISSNAEKGVSTITFIFPSTNKEIPVEASDDHPFFVFHRGWSSCNPHSTLLKYDLKVRQLMVGDVCVSLRKKPFVPSDCSEDGQHVVTDMPPPRQPPRIMHSPSTFASSPSTSSMPSHAAGPSHPTSTASVAHPTPSVSYSSSSLSSSPVQSLSTASGISTSSDAPSPKSQSEPLRLSDSTRKELEDIASAQRRTLNLSRRPASRTAERQKSSDECRDEEQRKNRKRRWSDPEH